MTNEEIKCPRCSKTEFWKTADKRLKCKSCRFIFTPKTNPFNISKETLEEIVSEFLLEHSTNIILQQVQISKYKLLKILTFFRKLMTIDLPEVFKNEIQPKLGPFFKLNTTPPIGILTKGGMIYAKFLPDLKEQEIETFLKSAPLLPSKKEEWINSFALVFKGNFYLLTNEKREELNVLKSFWDYLKRKFSTKRGIRKEKLPLYLGEYVWRYNYRKLTLKEQKERLLNLVFRYFEKKIDDKREITL